MRQKDVRSLKIEPNVLSMNLLVTRDSEQRGKGRSFTFRPKTSPAVVEEAAIVVDSAIAALRRVEGSEVESRVRLPQEAYCAQ